MFCQLHGNEQTECDGCMQCYALEALRQQESEEYEDED